VEENKVQVMQLFFLTSLFDILHKIPSHVSSSQERRLGLRMHRQLLQVSFLELVLMLDVGNADDSVFWMRYAALKALLEALEWVVTKLFIGSVAGLASTDRERHGDRNPNPKVYFPVPWPCDAEEI